VDDACPELSGHIAQLSNDSRVKVLYNPENQGVGGAVKLGYLHALSIGADVIVKIDGDGQMNPEAIPFLVEPILKGESDYSKGNRFFEIESIKGMPKLRILGNLILTFLTKLSSGYWKIFDPTNGFTAISRNTLEKLPLTKIDNRYFFESDMLFRLKLLGARVKDVPIKAIYGDEKSNLRIGKIIFEFPRKHARNFTKRIIYRYFIQDFNLGSILLPLGFMFTMFGLVLGFYSWIIGAIHNEPTEVGTLILVAMSVLVGNQMILSFFSIDTNED
jgi:glycosyltransferase involved in cell wall biosynthesis